MSAQDAAAVDAAVASDLFEGTLDLTVTETEDLTVETGGDMTELNGCKGLLACINGCAAKAACEVACRADATKNGRKLFLALDDCVASECTSAIPDGGARDGSTALGDAGAAPCDQPKSAACTTCRQDAVKKGGGCYKEYVVCEADTP